MVKIIVLIFHLLHLKNLIAVDPHHWRMKFTESHLVVLSILLQHFETFNYQCVSSCLSIIISDNDFKNRPHCWYYHTIYTLLLSENLGIDSFNLWDPISKQMCPITKQAVYFVSQAVQCVPCLYPHHKQKWGGVHDGARLWECWDLHYNPPPPSHATCADSDKIPGSRERICPRTQSPLCSYLPGPRKSVFLWPWELREATGISLLY